MIELECTFRHQNGDRVVKLVRMLASSSSGPETFSVDWGLAGEYRIAMKSGRVVGARRWRLMRRDLAKLRRLSTRWQSRQFWLERRLSAEPDTPTPDDDHDDHPEWRYPWGASWC